MLLKIGKQFVQYRFSKQSKHNNVIQQDRIIKRRNVKSLDNTALRLKYMQKLIYELFLN